MSKKKEKWINFYELRNPKYRLFDLVLLNDITKKLDLLATKMVYEKSVSKIELDENLSEKEKKENIKILKNDFDDINIKTNKIYADKEKEIKLKEKREKIEYKKRMKELKILAKS